MHSSYNRMNGLPYRCLCAPSTFFSRGKFMLVYHEFSKSCSCTWNVYTEGKRSVSGWAVWRSFLGERMIVFLLPGRCGFSGRDICQRFPGMGSHQFRPLMHIPNSSNAHGLRLRVSGSFGVRRRNKRFDAVRCEFHNSITASSFAISA